MIVSAVVDWHVIHLLQMAVDIPGLNIGQAEYYPYVYYKINVDMIESKF